MNKGLKDAKVREALLTRINNLRGSEGFVPLREWLAAEISYQLDKLATAEGNDIYRLQGEVSAMKKILSSINGLSRPHGRIAADDTEA